MTHNVKIVYCGVSILVRTIKMTFNFTLNQEPLLYTTSYPDSRINRGDNIHLLDKSVFVCVLRTPQNNIFFSNMANGILISMLFQISLMYVCTSAHSQSQLCFISALHIILRLWSLPFLFSSTRAYVFSTDSFAYPVHKEIQYMA